MSSHARKLCGMLIFILSTPTGSYSCMNLIIITIEKNALAVNEKSAGFTLHCSIVVNKPRGMASRYSAAQVCEILTGDSDKVEFLFPGSDDDLDAFELGEDGSDLEEEGGIGLGEDVLGLQEEEAVDEVQGKHFYNNSVLFKVGFK